MRHVGRAKRIKNAQKNYLSLYLMPVDAAALARLKAAFVKAGKKLDMGKSCIRFKRADDLPLDAIGAEIAAVPVETFVRLKADTT